MEMAVTEALLPVAAAAAIFDCDGTLVDSMGWHYRAWANTCAKFGLTMTKEILVELAGKPVDELFAIICERSGKTDQVDAKTFFTMRDQWYIDNHELGQLIEPVGTILQAAKARGLRLGVVSGGNTDHVMQSLTEAGILDLFDPTAIICAEHVKHGKPAPEGFELAAARLGVLPSLCVGYEDAKMGMQAIHAAGFMRAVDVTVLPGYPHLV